MHKAGLKNSLTRTCCHQKESKNQLKDMKFWFTTSITILRYNITEMRNYCKTINFFVEVTVTISQLK